MDTHRSGTTPGGSFLGTPLIVGVALLVGSAMLLVDQLGWAELPQPATVLISVLGVLALGLVELSRHRRRATGLMIAALVVGLLAVAATGRATSDGRAPWERHHVDGTALPVSAATIIPAAEGDLR